MKARSLLHSVQRLHAGLLVLLCFGLPRAGIWAASPPTVAITGTPEFPIDDTNLTLKPFPNVTVADTDNSWVRVTITASPADYGHFVGYTGSTNELVLQSADAATTSLRALVFVPTENLVPIGSTKIITFSVWAADTNSPALYSTTNSDTKVTITPVNDKPVATDDTYDAYEDTPLVVPLASGVFANDTDADGQTLVLGNFVQAQHGTVVIASDGSFNYTPATDFNGTDTFKYDAYDGELHSMQATVTISVTAAPDPPSLTVTGTHAWSLTDKQPTTIKPFQNVSITDVDGKPVSVTIVASPAGYGNLTGFTGGTNVISQQAAVDAQAALRALYFEPAENLVPVGSSQTITFTLWATDNSSPSLSSATNSTITVAITPVNDSPTMSGLTSWTITDKQSTNLFAGVTIADVDNRSTQTVTTVVSQIPAEPGTLLTNTSGFSGNVTNGYTFTGTPATATTALRALVFQPTENRVPVGSNDVTSFIVRVTDSPTPGLSITNTNTITAISINDPPTISGINATHQEVVTGGMIQPFSDALIQDPDIGDTTNSPGQLMTLVVTLSGQSGNGRWVPPGTGLVTGDTTFTLSDVSQEDATDALKALVFQAQTFPLDTTNTINFTVKATDSHAASATDTSAVVDVSTPFRAPGLSGTRTAQRVNDNSTVALFSSVSIQSFNGGTFAVIVHLDDDAKGSLVNLVGFTKSTSTSPASYFFNGTSEAATAAIRQMLFQPTNNRINGSTNETTEFSIILVDGGVTNAPDTSTTVIVTPVNDTPTLQGISALTTIADSDVRAPFPTVLIRDVDESNAQPLSMSIQFDDNAKGAFTTNSLVLSGFSSNNGSYTISGSPATVTTAIRQLVFAPTPHRLPLGLSEIVSFSISVDDGHGGVLANSATSIRVAALSGGPVVSVPSLQPVSLPITPPLLPLSLVSVSDPQDLTLTVRLLNPTWGSFTSNSLAGLAFSNSASGTYVFTGSASNATYGLANLEFLPNTNLVLGTVITFSIAITDQAANSASGSLAITLRQTQRSLIVTRTNDYDPYDLGVPESEKLGTLRKAVADAGSNDHITFDLRSPVPGLPDYPTAIHLKSPIVLGKNLTFDGPGAERLSIAGDGTSGFGVQLFQVNAFVTFNRLTLTKGYHPFAGGAVEVSSAGNLKLSYCAITDNRAGAWGGGIDVDGGAVAIDHCLVLSNRTSAAVGQGGGGLCLYTALPCYITDTTFSGNQQLAPAGLGGGALYAENADPGTEFDVLVLGCTFHDNFDAAVRGSSIRPNVFNTTVSLQNTIVADGQGKNLELDNSGMIISLGGNVSDDSTATIFSIGGVPYDVMILDPLSLGDRTNVNPALLSLADNGGPTFTYALDAVSPAIGNAVSNSPGSVSFDVLATDQRGFWRSDGAPDAGAFERNASQRLIIEEILFDPAGPNTNNEFIEFYVPRDSTSLNLAGYQVLVHGVLRHTFTSQTLAPGEALVLFSHDSTSMAVPTGVHSQLAAGNLQMDNNADTITLLNPSNQVVLALSYVGSFAASDPADPGYLNVPHQSLVLTPQFEGVYLPYQRVVAKEGGVTPSGLANPGYDASGNPLAPGNAPPRAYNDLAVTDVQTPLPTIPVLTNDAEPDAADTIRVVGVGVTNDTLPGVTGTTGSSVLGASVAINDSPSAGASVSYDPTGSAFLRSLPQGTVVIDTFQYTILDSSNGVDHARGTSTDEINANLAKATATVSITVTGLNLAPTPQADSVATAASLTTSEDAILDFTTWDTLLGNDTDPNSDDNGTTLTILSVQSGTSYANSLQTLSALGAWVTLDIRYNRSQTHITYDPRGSVLLNSLPEGQTADDTFYYSVMDRHGAIGTAAVHVLVTGVNDTPLPRADSLATAEDTILAVPQAQLLANDKDPDTGIVTPVPPLLEISAVSAISALGASVELTGGSVVYNPTVSATLNQLARKEVVVDTFTCTIRDSESAISNAVVSITVTGVNDTPHALPDTYTTGEEIPLPLGVPGLLINDFDDDVNGVAPDDTLRVVPTVGQLTTLSAPVTVNDNGSFHCDPRGHFDWLGQGETTNDTFLYVLMDHSFTIANDDGFSVAGNSAANILPVLANDAILSFETGANLRIVSATTPDKAGTVNVNAAGTDLIYTPQVNFVGMETFSYTVADGIGGTDTAQVSICVTVNPLNGRLTANADAFTVPQGTSVNLDLLANDNILPALGSGLTITGLGTPDHGGSAAFNGVGPNNRVAYTPSTATAAPFVEVFNYVISGGGTAQATGTVAVTVINRTNTLPANDDTFTVIVGGAVGSLDVLANDQILPGPNTNLTIVAIETPGVSGSVAVNAARNRLLYTPSPAIHTTTPETVFSYTVSDGAGGTATAYVALTIQMSGFIANDDVFSVMQNSGNNSLAVLLNDTILPNTGQTLAITDIGLGAHAPDHGGSVSINGARNRLIYTPAAGFTGEETFAYEITDGTAARAEGHVRVKVVATIPANSNPDAYAVDRDSANNTLPVLRNDYPLPATLLRLTITGVKTTGIQGTVALSGSGFDNALLYSPKAGFIGREIFTYETLDALGNKGTNQVAVSVGGLLARTDLFSVLSESVENRLTVLANDVLLPDRLGVRPITGLGSPDHGGTISTDPSRLLVLYTPAPNFVGTEQFTYQVQDDSGATYTETALVAVLLAGSDRSTGTVTLTIIGTNDPPTITGTQSLAITDKQTAMPFASVTIADVDQRSLEPLVVTVSLDNADKGTLQDLGGFANPSPGVYTMSGVGNTLTTAIRSLRFVPTENRIPVPTTETTLFTITVNDGHVVVTNADTTVNVTAINDPPTITGTVAGQRVYAHLTLRPFSGVTVRDVDNLTLQPLTITLTLAQPGFGTFVSLGGFVSSGNGVFTYNGTTAAQATTALRGLVYVPTPATRLLPGGSETNLLTLAVDDGFAPALVDNTTTIIALDAFVRTLAPLGTNSTSLFGYAVGAARDFVVVGAPKDVGIAVSSGAAYLFSRNLGGAEAWTQLQKLQGSPGAKDDQFGAAVAISGNMIAVGAPYRYSGTIRAGGAYVFERNSSTGQWLQTTTLVPSDGVTDDRFGAAVALSGDTLIVGSYQNKPGLRRSGAAYVYSRISGGVWTLVKKLAPTDGADGDNFGISVAIDLDTVVVGTQFGDAPARADVGAAYVYERNAGGLANSWGLTKKLIPADAAAGANLGHAVAISGDLLIAGAPNDDPNGLKSGSAYAFNRNQGGVGQWGQVNKFVQPDPYDSDDQFGLSVSVYAGIIAIGSGFDIHNVVPTPGAVYVYVQDYAGLSSWALIDRLAPVTHQCGGDIGFICALCQNTLVLGARTPPDTTGAFIYRLKFNNPPVLAQPIPDLTGVLNSPFTYAVPAATFADPDVSDTLSLAANLSQANWLSFNPATATFSGTPTSPATYPVMLTAADSDGATNWTAFNVAVPPALGGSTPGLRFAHLVWRADFFSPEVLANSSLAATVWGDNADPDGDGVINLKEYLFGTDPLHANPGDHSPVSVAISQEPGTVEITYPRRTDDWRLVYLLESSSDFINWEPVAPSIIVRETRSPISPTLEQVAQQVQVPEASSWPQFFQVKVMILVPDLP